MILWISHTNSYFSIERDKKKDESNQISQVIVRLGPYQNRKGARNWTTILITGICDLINP